MAQENPLNRVNAGLKDTSKKIIEQTLDNKFVELLILLGPLTSLYVFFVLFSLVFVVVTSFFDYSFVRPLSEATYVGLDNYAKILNDNVFHIAVKNVVLFTATVLTFQITLGLVLAALINRVNYMNGFYRFAIFAPVSISIVATGILWKWMYSPTDAGLINTILLEVGLLSNAYGFLTSQKYAIIFIGIMSVWKWTGFTMVIYLAGLREIPESLYEAARLDGANPLQQFRYITLPQLRSQHIINITLTTIGGLKVFAWVFVTTAGGPGNATEVFGTLLYRQAFNFQNVGYASAISTVLLIVIGVVTSVILSRR